MDEASETVPRMDTPSNTPVEHCVDETPTTSSMNDEAMAALVIGIEKAKAEVEEVVSEEDLTDRLKRRRLSSGSFYSGPDLDIGTEVKVKLSEGESPEEFVVQLVSSNLKLCEMMDDMNSHCNGVASGDDEDVTTHKVGDKCIAQFPEDDNWYRAVVTSFQTDYSLYEVNINVKTSFLWVFFCIEILRFSILGYSDEGTLSNMH